MTCLNVLDEEFIHDFVNVLVKAYLSTTDSNDSDACSYSIQEVLRAYRYSFRKISKEFIFGTISAF
jgi:hypothetical protein